MSIFKDEEVVNKQFFEEFGTDLTFQISYGLIVNQIMCSKYDSILSDCINKYYTWKSYIVLNKLFIILIVLKSLNRSHEPAKLTKWKSVLN